MKENNYIFKIKSIFKALGSWLLPAVIAAVIFLLIAAFSYFLITLTTTHTRGY